MSMCSDGTFLCGSLQFATHRLFNFLQIFSTSQPPTRRLSLFGGVLNTCGLLPLSHRAMLFISSGKTGTAINAARTNFCFTHFDKQNNQRANSDAVICVKSGVWRGACEHRCEVRCEERNQHWSKSFNIDKSVAYVLYRAYCQFTDDIGWTIQFFERLLAFSQHFDNEWNGSMVLQSFAYKLLNYTVIADGITSGINILCAASVVFSSSSSSSFSLPLLVVKLYARLFSP